MSDPTVSVVIVTYNKGDTISEAIESVLRQTYRDLELLVVDDGSTDDTAERVARFGPQVRYLRKENGGTGSARNLGIAQARGRFVAFLDGDDLWLPRKLERQMELFREQPEALAVQCSAHCVDERLRVFESRLCRPERDSLKRFLLFENLPAFSSAVVVRKEAFERIGGFATDLVILSDWEMACRLAREGLLLSHPEVLVLYRHYQKNQSRSVEIHVWSGVRALRRFFRNPERLDPAIRRLQGRAWARFYAMLGGGCIRNGDWRRGIGWSWKALATSPTVLPYLLGFPFRFLRRLLAAPAGAGRAAGPGSVVALAVLAGAVCALSPGGAFIGLLVAATCLLLRRCVTPPGDRIFLTRLFLLGFAARVLLSLALDLGSWRVEGSLPGRRGPIAGWDLGISDRTRTYLRMGDSDYYSQRGYCLAQYVSGVREPIVLQRIQEYGDHAYVPLIGGFYYFFGFSPITVKWLNGWVGSLQIIALFFLVRSCFQATIARWAAVGVAFFPTLVLWSATNLKEPLLLLLAALLLLGLRVIRVEPRWTRKALGAGLSLWIFTLLCRMGRSDSFAILLVCSTLALAAEWLLRRRWPALRRWALLLAAVLALIPLQPVARAKVALGKTVYRHMAYNYGIGMTYRYLPTRCYYAPGALTWGSYSQVGTRDLVRRIPKAVWHYLLEPFPARVGEKLTLLFLPQMIIWYGLLPLALVGIAAALAWNLWNCLFLAAPLLAWILVGALSNGNIGTLVRGRDMVTPMVLIFAAAGLWALARGRRGFSAAGPEEVQ